MDWVVRQHVLKLTKLLFRIKLTKRILANRCNILYIGHEVELLSSFVQNARSYNGSTMLPSALKLSQRAGCGHVFFHYSCFISIRLLILEWFSWEIWPLRIYICIYRVFRHTFLRLIYLLEFIYLWIFIM